MRFYLLGCALIIMSCATYKKQPKPPYTLPEPARAIRSETGDYRIEISDSLSGSWQLYRGSDRQSIDWSIPLNLNSARPLFHADPEVRLFFAAVDEVAHDTLFFTNRLVPMEEVLNFRDLGGLPVADGRHVRWGVLYRSGKLEDLSDQDMTVFKKLQIRTIVDLRSTGEIAEHPDRYPQGVSWVNAPIGRYEEVDRGASFRMLRKADGNPEIGEKFMMEGMQVYVSHTKDLAVVFAELLREDSLPLLIHCTSGKDRTGFVSAMILLAIGVDEQLVMSDYLLSNYYRYTSNERLLKRAAWIVGLNHLALRPVLDVRPAYLQSALDTIRVRYGTPQNYLREAVGLNDQDLEVLKNKLLE